MAPPGSASSSSSSEDYSNASHRYLKHTTTGTLRGDRSNRHQRRSKYHVTRHHRHRRPQTMAHTSSDDADLDPIWQDLDRYVPTPSLQLQPQPPPTHRTAPLRHSEESVRFQRQLSSVKGPPPSAPTLGVVCSNDMSVVHANWLLVVPLGRS